jgi:hypothetical protein
MGAGGGSGLVCVAKVETREQGTWAEHLRISFPGGSWELKHVDAPPSPTSFASWVARVLLRGCCGDTQARRGHAVVRRGRGLRQRSRTMWPLSTGRNRVFSVGPSSWRRVLAVGHMVRWDILGTVVTIRCRPVPRGHEREAGKLRSFEF